LSKSKLRVSLCALWITAAMSSGTFPAHAEIEAVPVTSLQASVRANGAIAVMTKSDKINYSIADPPFLTYETVQSLSDLKRKIVVAEQTNAKKAGQVFLAENAKKEGVTVLPSGVQYRVIKAGAGKQPTSGDSVTVKYLVHRINGQRASANSSNATECATYPLNKVRPGLQEVLQLMKEGAVWQIVVPPGAAQGGYRDTLDNAGVLVYEMELVAIK